jgi:hypothetical protein
MQGVLSAHSIITPIDVILALMASAAVVVAWYRERTHKPASARWAGRGTRYAVIWARWFLGVHALFSGPNYFLHLYPQMQMAHPLAGPLQHYMEAVGLFGIVKVIESVVGVCLVLNVYVPAAALLEMPISFNIFYLSVFVVADPRTLWTGPRELLLNAFLIVAYGGWMAPIFKARTGPRPLWDASDETARVAHTPT